MLVDIKPPLLRFFEATNAHDADSVAALFTDDALVHDERTDHRGREAIRDWAEGTYVKYDMRLSPSDTSEDSEVTVVRTKVAGRFLGSPIDLSFRFVTQGEQISELRIG